MHVNMWELFQMLTLNGVLSDIPACWLVTSHVVHALWRCALCPACDVTRSAQALLSVKEGGGRGREDEGCCLAASVIVIRIDSCKSTLLLQDDRSRFYSLFLSFFGGGVRVEYEQRISRLCRLTSVVVIPRTCHEVGAQQKRYKMAATLQAIEILF